MEEKFKSFLEIDKGTVNEIVEELNKLGVTKIDKVIELECKIGKTIKVIVDSGKEFYIGLDTYGFLQIIREDSLDGKIVYMPIDD